MASTLQRVLDLWRESERQLAAQQPDSPEITALAAQIERLRRLYQRITVHERRDIGGLKGADRTIVRSELLATRSRAAAGAAVDAVARARTLRDPELQPGLHETPAEAVSSHR
jgi:DNA-binding transcriptional regulator YbjK